MLGKRVSQSSIVRASLYEKVKNWSDQWSKSSVSLTIKGVSGCTLMRILLLRSSLMIPWLHFISDWSWYIPLSIRLLNLLMAPLRIRKFFKSCRRIWIGWRMASLSLFNSNRILHQRLFWVEANWSYPPRSSYSLSSCCSLLPSCKKLQSHPYRFIRPTKIRLSTPASSLFKKS